MEIRPSGPNEKQPPRAGRTAFIPGSRLPGWVERFAASHGALQEEPDDGGTLLRAADGATALLKAPWPVDGRPGKGTNTLERLASLASQERRLGVILVRRGGYAVGVVSGGKVSASKSGSRYVQSRSAAGGSSQQRFARRRENQANALAEAVAGYAAGVFAGQSIEYLVLGGDAALSSAVLEERALKEYASRKQLPFLAVADPNATVLRRAAADACAVRIDVTDPL
ncbi:acVLRF1 family peptidyl-tRNA hydrolase [Arthrobacter sp. MMS18-M83]|uniref:acVLRF1 family peptidyl-tRNA hydrolase n=1 Tax=Arthrobacter sp. MMS18-M83 TaxID=2996261 RepID=UPI00227CDD61|nr:acVLRF1 family peptidyl-tRNA hydrolase [Arthrobacter sp. MMS18-M83]WAH97087.1 acVLRF1 family peptidyl-tRNA hydrolase [Arthrobacter sp. MMS18-M83]